ncbi:zinc ABC transporter substrate-binding protein [Mesorhizobium sp. YIM 152430]|uniref:zinc ABC transporter substrate-binding protein n=1 Tax=Mesorhizobium sp. YIM 152430 TaxID=3031761 RepID=UPI0023DAE4F2|nr:zinc ABC transporter substrate-binding protein [Mesorhizobium sp. YIM 152430]MDF1601019.1 zinc ABC transporter substrate-binding protein [Mesorhizobium sp. YIM 152430]
MKRFRTALFAGTALTIVSAAPAVALDGVVASIKPVHSLVAAVMGDVGAPSLLVSGAGSPHTYSMRPSEAQMLESASLIFWVGHDLEMFLDGPLDTLAGNATVVELGEADGLTRLAYREGGPFESHEHDHEAEAEGEHDPAHESASHDADDAHDHAHEHEEAAAESDHAHEHEDDEAEAAEAAHSHEHAHEDEADAGGAHDHAHEAEAGHAHGAYDMHFWLDPENAKVMVREIEAALSAADPDNAQTYAANAAATTERLDVLLTETQAAIDNVDNRGFIVFHDAYQYYENRFGIEAAGSITVSPEVMPGAQRLTDIQERVRELGAACVFSEPQFEPRLVSVITEGTEAKAGVLDPLGADLEEGAELYFELIGNLTTSLTTCLSES